MLSWLFSMIKKLYERKSDFSRITAKDEQKNVFPV